VVKVDAGRPLPFVRMADSNKTRVGQWAIAIGSPFGQQNTMTAGIVSALNRKSVVSSVEGGRFYPQLIQTDASINPGNSGGPLLNINGELIGINVLIYSPTGGNVGLGYAIPSNVAKNVMEQLITRGRVVRGYLGLRPGDIPAGLRARLGTDKGAYVEEVTGGSPAQKGGLRADDVITRFNGRTIENEVTLRDAISATAPGTRVPGHGFAKRRDREFEPYGGQPALTSRPRRPRPLLRLRAPSKSWGFAWRR
jgi:serine protease Do